MANEFKVRKGLIVHGSGSTILDVRNNTDSIFSVTDSLTGTLLSIGDTSGIPIFTVGSDDSAKLGKFNFEAIRVSGSNAFATGSMFGTASYALVAAGSVAAAGSNGQLLYNSASVFAGTTELFISGGLLTFTSSANPPAAPSSSVLITAKSMANRMIPQFNGPSNLDTPMQPAIFGNTVILSVPGTTAGNAINFASSWNTLAAGSGAQIDATLNSTNDIGGLSRRIFQTGATATSSSYGTRTTNQQVFLGNAAGRGGFFFFARAGVEAESGTYVVEIGLRSAAGGFFVEPSSETNIIFFGKDSADTTWQVMTRAAGAINKIDTGVTITLGQVIDFFIFSAPNSQAVTFFMKNPITGDALYTSPTPITTNLPSSTTFLYPSVGIGSTSGATSKQLGLGTMYLEKDF